MDKSIRVRAEDGTFSLKSDSERKVHSIRATEDVWRRFGEIADAKGMTRADLVEELVKGELFTTRDLRISAEAILGDASVTRNGKDRGAVRRALAAAIDSL